MINSTPELRPLTNRQQQIYDLIKVKIQDTGMPPTRAEIATFFGFKSSWIPDSPKIEIPNVRQRLPIGTKAPKGA